MAVPKKKTSKSKRNMRRADHALTARPLSTNPDTGEQTLSHTMTKSGYYNGKKVFYTAEELETLKEGSSETKAETL